MIVIYYTTVYFLDAVIETIQCIKDKVELHVIIEISPDSKKSTIIDVENLNHLSDIENCGTVLGNVQWSYLKKYFERVASVRFVVHKNKRNFSLESIMVARVAGKYLRKLNPDIIHFDSITARSIGLYLYIQSLKVFITVHDPVPHVGENSWKIKVPRFVFFRLAKGYIFYSNFASSQFAKNYKSISKKKYVIRLQPYTFISQLITNYEKQSNAILFFGRLSFYKGIDILLEAIPKVLERFPNEQFIIAGNLDYSYEIKKEITNKYKNNIVLITKYLPLNELAKYIERAKFIVCPYREATQSGVLMTAHAAGKMVIASNVGAFPEYIQNDINGMLTEPNSTALANKIIEALENDKYKEIEKNVKKFDSKEVIINNQKSILEAYLSW